MSNLQKQFVPYELAVKLKELGFDEECLYYFNKQENNQLWQDLDSGYYRNSIVSRGNLLWGDTYDNGNVSAPLWQQAEDWFREKHNLHYGIRNDGTHNSWYLSRWGKRYGTYEEARQACLEKLIELVEQK